MNFFELRKKYHESICLQIVWIKPDGSYPNFADSSSKSSRDIAIGMLQEMGCTNYRKEPLSDQQVGKLFEEVIRDFVVESFRLLSHLRPGKWVYSAKSISNFEQYEHLANVEKTVRENRELASIFGIDYIIKPDIIVARVPVPDEEINRKGEILVDRRHDVVRYSPLRAKERSKPILHASISCKWTIRSDRSQNTRTEAINLIRNRKGHTPHIVAVTAEPLPTRIASLALGTGDLDCVYHIALHELEIAVKNNPDQQEMLRTLIDGKRLRDISDLPFDLAV
ncbi:MAG: NgoMIV family type II restriction endonuclease [Roseiflexus sp.]